MSRFANEHRCSDSRTDRGLEKSYSNIDRLRGQCFAEPSTALLIDQVEADQLADSNLLHRCGDFVVLVAGERPGIDAPHHV